MVRRCTYPSIHFFVSRSRYVWCEGGVCMCMCMCMSVVVWDVRFVCVLRCIDVCVLCVVCVGCGVCGAAWHAEKPSV